MGQVTFAINGRSYRIGCADGEEKRLRELAREVAARVDRLVMEFGQVGEARLLLMAGLLACDELLDVRANLDVMVAEAAERLHTAAAEAATGSASAPALEPAKPARDEAPAVDAGPASSVEGRQSAPPAVMAQPASAVVVTAVVRQDTPNGAGGTAAGVPVKAHRGQRIDMPGRSRSA